MWFADYFVKKNVFGTDYELITPQADSIKEINDSMWGGCDGLLAWHDFYYSKEIISKLSRCRGIVRLGTGVDNIDLEAASNAGIIVSNVPDYGTNDVADHTWALILSLERGIVRFNQSMLDQGPWSWELGMDLNRIQDRTLGIIGLGRIGTAVAMRAKAFGMRILFYDPYAPIGIEKSLSIQRVHNQDDLIKQSEIITIHTPLTDLTKRMVGKEFFNKMKDGSSIYNTARGEIIDFNALYKALKEDKIRCAGLDVLEEEPIDYSHPLIKSWKLRESWIDGRLVITPHAAFYNNQSFEEMELKAVEELKRIVKGKKPLSRVN